VQAIPDIAHADVAVHACPPGLADRLPAPGVGEVQVWYRGVREEDEVATLLVLDEAERDRAERYRLARDRVRFAAHHAFVRRVLARYLGSEPDVVPIRIGVRGKPELPTDDGIAFNSSRSAGWSIVALARDPIGVDVEAIRPIDDSDALADDHFTVAERRLFHGVPETSRDRAFLELWTRKEAVVKAFGVGLSVSLKTFDVAGEADAHDGPSVGRYGADGFVVQQLDAPEGWVAAVAVAVSGVQLAVRYMDTESQLP
jgi:4'-phosphopantetheinyl transferase